MAYLLDFISKISDVILPYALKSLYLGLIPTILSFFIWKKDCHIVLSFILRELFFAYSLLIICETVFRRLGLPKVTTDFLGFSQLFENPWYIASSVENIIMFVPFGLFLGLAFRKHLKLIRVILLTLVFSLCIEITQYILVVGEAQLIDLCTDMLGSMIGYGISAPFIHQNAREKASHE